MKPGHFDPHLQREMLMFKDASDKLEREMHEFLRKLVPVLDKVEQTCRGIDQRNPEQLAAFAATLALLPDVIDDAATSVGLVRIRGVGEPARSMSHEVKHVSPSDQPHGTVLEVLECGWEYDGTILKRALVIASENPTENTPGN